jgi:transcriptional regulator
MYIPKPFEETDIDTLRELIRAAPLGTLVINSTEGLVANHIPFVLSPSTSGIGVLRAHVPRVNPISSLLRSEHECIVIFHGPEGYISPSWYATKKEHGKVVPTWNYSVVHVHGRINTVDDPEWVLGQIQALTEQQEKDRSEPWNVSDAPESFTRQLMKVLVGLEVTVEAVAGITKASQNQPVENQESVLKELACEPSETKLYELMSTVLNNGS